MKDYYRTLGVLPSAEDIVIRAAYRVLAQRYHPDRWNGASEEAVARMAEINEAYAILSDEGRRAQYDKKRAASKEANAYDEQFDAQPEATDPIEADWRIASKYHPDLPEIASRLSKISTRLAFTFRVLLLETKSFGKRAELAEKLETDFLKRYFGNDVTIIGFARSLILEQRKAAAKALNDAVRVLGSGVDPSVVIEKIKGDFNLGPGVWASETGKRAGKEILMRYRETRELSTADALALLNCAGAYVKEETHFLFDSAFRCSYKNEHHTFGSPHELKDWVIASVIPKLSA